MNSQSNPFYQNPRHHSQISILRGSQKYPIRDLMTNFRKVSEFITWERLAISLIGILIALISFVGKGITSEIGAMRSTMTNLNETLIGLKIEMAVSTQNNHIVNKQIEIMNSRILDLERRVK